MEKLCGECGEENTTFWCDRCNKYFCTNHIDTHLNSKKCKVCEKIICIEMMSDIDSEMCFRCMVLNDISKINEIIKKI